MTDGIDTHGKETIAALVTGQGAAAVAIVRISGAAALTLAEGIAGCGLTPRQAKYRALRDAEGGLIDQGLVIYFPAPASFTGEDVVEFQCHGAAPIVDWLLETLYQAGARAAQPGEFSLRAFLNNRLDLTRAEAIADLIGSGSRAAAQAALRSLSGEFADRVEALQAQLTEVRVRCEAWLDFPDEDIDQASVSDLAARSGQIADEIAALLKSAEQGVTLTNGVRVVIAGPANAGKSSLLNRLSAESAAIVSAQAGTTRDALERRLVIGGVPVEIVDTAGMRETSDEIEREGMARAKAAIGSADMVLWLSDITEDPTGESAKRMAASVIDEDIPCAIVLNKLDLLESTQGLDANSSGAGDPAGGNGTPTAGTADFAAEAAPIYRISAQRGDGLEAIEALICGQGSETGGAFSARRRHLAALERARDHATAAQRLTGTAPDLAAEELRAAQTALSELTGTVTSDELLGEIFSTFCIGK